MKTVVKKTKQKTKEVKTMKSNFKEMVDKAKAILNSEETTKLSSLVIGFKNDKNEMSAGRCVVQNNENDIFSSIMGIDDIYEDKSEISLEEIIQSLSTKYLSFSTMESRERFIRDLNQSKDEFSAILLAKMLNIFGYIDDKVLEEIKISLSSMTKSSGYHAKIIEIITSIPFGIKRPIETDYKKIENIMNQKIYGMEKVKGDILNMIALNNNSRNQINKPILIFGPPGVGKTIFAETLAQALGLPFCKINFSSAYDRSYIKGANRTWNNSSIGEITRILMKARCMNPVILFDEIDKAGGSSAGNIVDTITEILDPTQRCFKDDYLLVTYDMSNAYIVCTANDIEQVPSHIKDRCHVIKINNYSKEDLFNITKYYIIKQIVSDYGLMYQLDLDVVAVNKLITIESLRTIKMIITSLIGLKLRTQGKTKKEIHIKDIPDNIIQEYTQEVQRPPIGFCR